MKNLQKRISTLEAQNRPKGGKIKFIERYLVLKASNGELEKVPFISHPVLLICRSSECLK
jgi:hypothetical protein